ncbi:MAG: transglutaminase family protein, partial [Proteobacteria bacterium]|nr:transglutaminase family protein [Pseudomonadota bacterium]
AVRAAVAQGATLPDDVYARTLVRANLRLPEPRAVEALRVRIELKDREGVLPALDGPGERVLERGADHVVLEVTAPVAPDGRSDRAAPAPAGGRPDTQANAVLQADDPAVVALAATLRIRGAGPYRQARALQDWVATHLEFDPGLGLVPASEAVRDRRGSCLASAVLLASLARALDIPARVVVGYAYVANVFAGHAWTEIESGGRWLPLDAALYRPGPADAARIALARQFGEPGAGLAEVVGLLGHERIRVLAFRLHGRWTEVADGAAAYELQQERYRNPWLGLEVGRPEGFRFAQLDATYPDSTVVALLADDGSQLRLRVLNGDARASTPAQLLAQAGFVGRLVPLRVAEHPALRVRSGPRAALAFRQGADLWLVTAEGPRALSAFGSWLGQIHLAAGPAPPLATPRH